MAAQGVVWHRDGHPASRRRRVAQQLSAVEDVSDGKDGSAGLSGPKSAVLGMCAPDEELFCNRSGRGVSRAWLAKSLVVMFAVVVVVAVNERANAACDVSAEVRCGGAAQSVTG